MALTHDELCQIACRFLQNNGFKVAFHDRFVAYVGTGEQPDAIGFRNLASCLIEVKCSRADFLADRKKHFRIEPSKGMGDWRSWPSLVLSTFLICRRAGGCCTSGTGACTKCMAGRVTRCGALGSTSRFRQTNRPSAITCTAPCAGWTCEDTSKKFMTDLKWRSIDERLTHEELESLYLAMKSHFEVMAESASEAEVIECSQIVRALCELERRTAMLAVAPQEVK